MESYSSKRAYQERFDALAVYCSDGRFGDQCDDFLHGHLGLTQYDRLIVPGGAGALADRPATRQVREHLLEDLRFLVDAHGLNRVVLISHERCGFYGHRLGLGESEMGPQQRQDLEEVARTLCGMGIEQVEGYLAVVDGNAIAFVPVTDGK